jgi:ATP-dependent protease ClpP protease subunit
MTDFIWGGSPAVLGHNHDIKEENLYRSQNEIWFSCDVKTLTINKLIKLMYAVIHDEHLSAYREKGELEIVIHIDSYGGEVKAAFKFIDFVKQLQSKSVKVSTIINGAACSAATLMAIVGSKRQITEHSYAMIHELSSVVWGEYTKIKSYTHHLDTLHNQIVALYEKKCSLEKEAIQTLLEKETWFSAQEYLEKGFVDEVI